MILTMAAPEEERAFRLGWSLWRRAHQAVARRCHMANRALLREKTSENNGKPSSVRVISTTSTLHRASAKLADEHNGHASSRFSPRTDAAVGSGASTAR